jgi:hypothetical protein
MRRLRIVALLICALFSVSTAPHRATAQDAQAQNAQSQNAQAEAMQAAKDLMAVMSVDTVRQMVQGMTNQVWPSIERELHGKRPDIDQATISELRTEFENIQMRYMAGIMTDAPKIYAKHFTAAELRDMLAFYKTSTGQKTLKVMPQVMTDIFAMIMPQMQGLQVQIITAFQEVLRKKGINL